MATRWRWPPESCAGLAVDQPLDLQQLRRPVDAPLDLGAVEPLRREPELQVPAHRLGRIERVGLEHHREAAVLRVEVGDVAAADDDACPPWSPAGRPAG